MKKILFWTPRILGTLFIVFLSLFALDMFSDDLKWYEQILGFLIHLLPSLVLLVFLIMAWKKHLLGSIMFLVAGIFYIFLSWGKMDGWSFLVISGPAILIGILFIPDKYINKK